MCDTGVTALKAGNEVFYTLAENHALKVGDTVNRYRLGTQIQAHALVFCSRSCAKIGMSANSRRCKSRDPYCTRKSSHRF
jgi:hypothetical protein